jgi:hypothetical protein
MTMGQIDVVIDDAVPPIRDTNARTQASAVRTPRPQCATPRWTVAASGERRFAVGLSAENESTAGDTQRADTYKMRLWRCCPRK